MFKSTLEKNAIPVCLHRGTLIGSHGKWPLSRDLHAVKKCTKSLVEKALLLWNSKVPGAVPQDWVTIAVKSEARCLATEHTDDAEVAGV